MKKLTLFFSVIVLAVINLSFTSVVIAQKNDKFKTSRNAIPNRYIVVLNDDVVKVNDIFSNALRAEVVNRVSSDLVSSYGGQVHLVFSAALKGYAVQMPLQQALALSLDPRVKYVEEDFLVFPDTTQTNAPWGLDRIDQRNRPLDTNYNYTSTGTGVHAYIIDSGIRSTHAEFTGRIGIGKDFINDGKNGEDCDGHGTHVAGTIGGTTYGVAKNVTLHSLRIFPCEDAGSGSGSIGAIDWITANHIKPAVVNMSLGGSYQTSFNTAVQNSIAQGITYVVSGGNENNDSCDKSPASTPTAITVGSTTINDVRSSFSNYGNCVDIFAPGSQILSSWFTSDTATNTISGTSMAAPHVTGVVALFLEANPTASPAAVASSLINAATSGVISNVGSGSPNLLLYSSVPLNLAPTPTPVPTPAPAVRINESGPATPYPSTYSVSGLSGSVADSPIGVQVRINGFSHSYTGEVGLVLEGPTGAKMLIQGLIGAEGEDANNITYSISDAGSAQMTTSTTLTNGSVYKPTAISLPTFPPPGPGTAYNNPGPINGGAATLASTFAGTNPNGVWKLYVKDEALGDRGRIASWSVDISTVSNAPTPPSTVVAEAVSPTQINVFWSAAPAHQNITSYNLRINGSTIIRGITYLSYPVTGLTPGTNYTFEVQAVNASGVESSWSPGVTMRTQNAPTPVAPAPPATVVTDVVSSTQLNVFWSGAPANQNVTSYNLRVNGATIIRGITYLSYPVTGLNPGTTYTFEVQAVNASGTESAWSQMVSAATGGTSQQPNVPTPPTTVITDVVSASQINVFWSSAPANQNVTSYNLRINGAAVIRGITYLSFPVTGLAPGTTYTFEVQAVNSSGVESAWSTPVSATTSGTAPAPGVPSPPSTVITDIVSASQINVFWSAAPANQNVTRYNLRINGGTVIRGITYLSFPVTGLSPGTTYTFEVQAVNSSGVESAWSTPVSATTGGTAPAPGVPSAPTTVITDVVSASQINVFWNAPAANQNITSYNLRINGATVIRGITYLSFPVTGLAANTTYTFEVQAVNSSGTESNWSVIKSATTASSSAALILSPEYFRVARYDEQDKNAQRSSALYLPVRIVMDFNFTGGHINRQTL